MLGHPGCVHQGCQTEKGIWTRLVNSIRTLV